MKPGRFIVFDGCDAAGKTTQLRLLHAALTAKGISAILTREPGGTPFGEKLREAFLEDIDNISIVAQIYTMMAIRAQHIEKKIIPTLAAGTWVLCDRFIDSSRVYQGYFPGYDPVTKQQDMRFVDLIDKCYREIVTFHPGYSKSQYFIFDLPTHVALERLSVRTEKANAIDVRPRAFHDYVGSCYRDRIYKDYPRRILIDAQPDIDSVHATLLSHIFPNVEVQS